MNFKGTPRDLAYAAAKWFVIFCGAVLLLYVSEVVWSAWFADDSRLYLIKISVEPILEEADLGFEDKLGLTGSALFFGLFHSVIIAAFGSSILGWIIAFIGIFLANGVQRLAAVVFGFATFVTVATASDRYWFAAIPSVLALGYLTLWAWSLRNWVEVVRHNPARAENFAQQQSALKQREMGVEDIISRR